jgi:exosortase/archaeosortase family protein
MINLETRPIGSALVALAAVASGLGLLKAVPWLESEVFVGGASRLASLFSGAAMIRTDAGIELLFSGQPLLVTTACSATDFFLMTAAVLGWHLAQLAERRSRWPVMIAGAVIAAVPFTLFVNALRLVTVAQAHRWVIPRMPAAYDAFLHMIAGAAVFLPALILLNLLCELHGRTRTSSSNHA